MLPCTKVSRWVVQIHPPKPKSDVRKNGNLGRKRERERERKSLRTYPPSHALLVRVFITFKCGARLCSDELTLVVMIA